MPSATREELWHRLSGEVIELSPLRERKSDVALLVARFLAEAVGVSAESRLRASVEALDLFAAQDWPGDVRELRMAVYRAAASIRTHATSWGTRSES